MTTGPAPIILAPADHAVLGEAEFGTPGLLAVESIGPFTRIRACGPLVTVHDSVIAAGLGIGHHPHRYHERLFYLERGTYQLEFRLPGYRAEVRTIEAEEGQYFPIELKLAREPGVKPAPWYDRPQDVVEGRVFGPLRKEEPEAAPGPDPRLRPELQEPVGGPPPSVERGERGALEFRVTPENASVYVDGEFLGTGRELVQMERGFAVGAGEHTVEVLAPRHAPRTLTVSVAAGESRQVVVELEGVQGGQN